MAMNSLGLKAAAFLMGMGLSIAGAQAQSLEPVQEFPPVNATDCRSNGYQYLTWYQGQRTNGQLGATCQSGMVVVDNALPPPNCAQGKYVAYDNGQYVCRNVILHAASCGSIPASACYQWSFQ